MRRMPERCGGAHPSLLPQPDTETHGGLEERLSAGGGTLCIGRGGQQVKGTAFSLGSQPGQGSPPVPSRCSTAAPARSSPERGALAAPRPLTLLRVPLLRQQLRGQREHHGSAIPESATAQSDGFTPWLSCGKHPNSDSLVAEQVTSGWTRWCSLCSAVPRCSGTLRLVVSSIINKDQKPQSSWAARTAVGIARHLTCQVVALKVCSLHSNVTLRHEKWYTENVIS